MNFQENNKIYAYLIDIIINLLTDSEWTEV